MQIDLLANTDYLYGDVTKNEKLTEALVEISARFLKSNAGVRAAFFTNSKSVSLTYSVNDEYVLQRVGRTLTNGICYAISKEPNGFLTKAECLYKGGEAEEIFSQTGQETYFYQLFLPSFNKIQSLCLIIDDDAAVSAAKHLKPEPIVFLGGKLTLGHGSTFASAMYSQIISRNTNRDFYNLALPADNFLSVNLASEVKALNPSIIVSEIDCADMTLRHLRGNLSKYLKTLIEINTAPVIAFSSVFCGDKIKNYARKTKHIKRVINKLSQKYPNRIVFINGEDVFAKYDYDTYSFSNNSINDYGNAILADRLTSFISDFCN